MKETKKELLSKMRAAMGQAEILEGREKGDIDALAKKSQVVIDNYYLVENVDKETGEVNRYYFITVSDDKQNYYSTPSALTKLIDEFGDNVKRAIISVGEAMPLKSDSRRTFRQIKILDVME